MSNLRQLKLKHVPKERRDPNVTEKDLFCCLKGDLHKKVYILFFFYKNHSDMFYFAQTIKCLVWGKIYPCRRSSNQTVCIYCQFDS